MALGVGAQGRKTFLFLFMLRPCALRHALVPYATHSWLSSQLPLQFVMRAVKENMERNRER